MKRLVTGMAPKGRAAVPERGKDDWYLLSKSELNLIYENLQKTKKLNMGSDWYWYSSEYNNRDAWDQRFSDGYQGNYYVKDYSFSVQVVQAFYPACGGVKFFNMSGAMFNYPQNRRKMGA
jgi:hypothetical protein